MFVLTRKQLQELSKEKLIDALLIDVKLNS